jgi:hypothetical protein
MAIQPGAFFSPNVNDPLISTLTFVHKPEIFEKLVPRYPRQTILGFLQLMGRMVPVAQTAYSTTEENRLLNPITIGSFTNGSGTNVVITLGPGSYFTDPVTSASYSYPRIGDRVEFTNGTQGYIIAKNVATPNAHTITVQAVSAAYNPQTACNVGDSVGIFSDAFAEGSTGPAEMLIPQIDTFTNNTEIYYDWAAVTSSEQGNQTWVKYTFPEGHPQAGQVGNFYYIKAEGDTILRFNLKREIGVLTNDIGDGSVIDPISGTGFPVRFTRGLIPTLRAYGQGLDYVGQPGMGTFDSIVRLMNKNYSVEDNMMLMGLNFGLGFKNFGVDVLKNGSVIYNQAEGTQMDTVSLGFKSLEFSTGHRFHTMVLPALAHADSTGLPGMPYPDLAVILPMNEKVVDKATNTSMEVFAIRYKKPEGKGANKYWKYWETGGNSDSGTDNTLQRRANIECEEGAQIYGAARCVLITKKAA